MIQDFMTPLLKGGILRHFSRILLLKGGVSLRAGVFLVLPADFSNKPKNSHGSLFTPQNMIHYLVQVPWDKRKIGQNSVWGPFLTRLVHSRYFGSVKRYKRQNELPLPLGNIGDQKRSGKLSKKLKTLLGIPMYPQNL